MTNIQTKKELNKEFKPVKYILTSNIRTKLIIAIYNSPKNLDELRRDLIKPSATILHGLKELININLVQKNNKNYELTSNGYLIATNMIKLIDNWYSIDQNKTFWNIHNLSDIPEDILKDIYLLKDIDYITSTTSDLSNAFNKYTELLSQSSSIKIILPIYSENHIKQIITNLNNNNIKKLELIISKNILKSIKRNRLFRESLLKNENVKVICVKENIKLFLTYSKDFMALTLFFKDGHYDDSQILIGKTKNSIKWALKLYKLYKRRGAIYYDKK